MDAAGASEEEAEADDVEPGVQRDEVEAGDGDAVVGETADDAYGHEQQQRCQDERQPTCNAVVGGAVVGMAGGVETELDSDESHHRGDDEPRHLTVRQFPVHENLNGVDEKHDDIQQLQRQEEIAEHTGEESRAQRFAVVFLIAAWDASQEKQ